MTMASAPSPVEKMAFESALAELETIVKNLESGKVSLEESITAYERGMALKSHCEAKLRDAQMKIEKIVVGSNGSLTTQKFEDK
ncbi:MAG: exodeoxyribonuclease VII small subunit [Alphaproteobacteria bacterium RIFCSPHIGHO2_12_FULL_45_9]|nr:MAG: exodeoxyribonuclease VII small subunit [Alphaproteobacteria bacterium RIFCSPHIGHO2_02_FULL_46_13]OFW97067.1 MAG: exodeoxyribonuclease VII small subunit [Alphaproteobacteria bacterium RIFCSPHIGHO2_12_FULL_45_9]